MYLKDAPSEWVPWLASAARTTAQTLDKVLTLGAKGIILVIDATVKGGAAPSLTPTIDGFEPVSGQYFNLLTGAAIAAVSTKILRVAPGLTAAANVTANDWLPPVIRINIAVANADSMTYSASYAFLY